MLARRHSTTCIEHKQEVSVCSKRKRQDKRASLDDKILGKFCGNSFQHSNIADQEVESEDEDDDDGGFFIACPMGSLVDLSGDQRSKVFSEEKEQLGCLPEESSVQSKVGGSMQEKSEEIQRKPQSVPYTRFRKEYGTQSEVQPLTPQVLAPHQIFETPVMKKCEVLYSSSEAEENNNVAPIFNPATQRKYVCLIRHGESEYNARAKTKLLGAGSKIFDARLTEEGKRQCWQILQNKQLARAVKKTEVQLQDALWVVSPLTRSIQTFLHACTAEESIVFGKMRPSKVILSALLRESCVTSGDIGRPLSKLKEEFPEFFQICQCEDVDEEWWHQPDLNRASNKKLGARETKQVLKVRVGRFSSWLSRRPEKLIILVGHGLFFEEMFGRRLPKSLDNAEVVCMPY